MSENTSKDNNESEKERAWRRDVFLAIVLSVIIIVAVLTFMWFNKKEKESKETEPEKKKQRLDEVNDQIAILEAKKEKIVKWEKNIKRGENYRVLEKIAR